MLNNLVSKSQNDIVSKIHADDYDGGHKQDKIGDLSVGNGSNLIQMSCSNRLSKFVEISINVLM